MLEGLKDQLLLVRRYADTGITDAEGNDTRCRRMLPIASARRFHLKINRAFVSKFESIRQEVPQYLRHTLLVDHNILRTARRQPDIECQFFAFCLSVELGAQFFHQHRQRNFFRQQFELAFFYLGQIQNIVDQQQQIAAR